ncbi:crustacean cardioactive peptide [Arctopsyche grandis]|uniref:crustacean cardioactive peptide n=1 Tax=Arctopsyche grandis TaxID=121162 RepID=UPI00406D6AAC
MPAAAGSSWIETLLVVVSHSIYIEERNKHYGNDYSLKSVFKSRSILIENNLNNVFQILITFSEPNDMAFKTLLFAFLVLTCVAILPKFVSSQRPVRTVNANIIDRNYERMEDLPTEILAEPRKRPFCNAFTGCGRKRSSPPIEQLMQEQSRNNIRKLPMEDSMESLLDLSSEPAVEDLSRQIMSEAKMWEAIQEAGAELMRRKQMTKSNNLYPVSMNAQ